MIMAAKEDFLEKELKKLHDLENLRDAFFNKLFILDYTKDKKERIKLIKQAKELAQKIPELKGWPKDKERFWDVESYGWNNKIPKEVRAKIEDWLKKRSKKNILSLGAGCCPYLKDLTLIDISDEMLKQAQGKKKIRLDLDKEKLPFKDQSFDTIIMSFILDYLKSPRKVIKEAKRVLKNKGNLLIIQSKIPVDDFYRMQEKKHIDKKMLNKLLKNSDLIIEEKIINNKAILFAEAKV